MENSSYALVLTGDVLPAFSEETVWPALATYFRMEPQKLREQLVARAPLTIKQGDDLGKLQTLQEGIAGVGAESEVCAPDGRPALFVVLGGKPRGPVPRVLVEDRIERGIWPSSVSVAEVGSTAWTPYATLGKAVAAAPAAEPAAGFDDSAFATRDTARAYQPTARADLGHSLAAVGAPSTDAWQVLPAGDAIHAGFWRRCAAMLVDSLILGIGMGVVQTAVGLGAIGTVGSIDSGADAITAMFGSMMLILVLSFVGQWLYFALFECGSAQATPGKMTMGIKVVDARGARIGFGQATGRYFGKIISSLVLGIGYLLAGWSDRKQALHDMMAGTFVVFGEVKPGQPLPQRRTAMPWYGWIINIVFLGLPVLVMLGVYALAQMTGGALGLH